MESILERNRRLALIPTKREFGEKIRLTAALFGCWHGALSRPFTKLSASYRVCLKCGARKHFDPGDLKTYGAFYFPPAEDLY